MGGLGFCPPRVPWESSARVAKNEIYQHYPAHIACFLSLAPFFLAADLSFLLGLPLHPLPNPVLRPPFLYQPRSPRLTSGVGSQQTSTQKRIDEKQNAHLGQGILLSHISNKAEDTTVSFFFPHTGGGLLQQKGRERRRHDTATTPSRPLARFSPTPPPTRVPLFTAPPASRRPPPTSPDGRPRRRSQELREPLEAVRVAHALDDGAHVQLDGPHARLLLPRVLPDVTVKLWKICWIQITHTQVPRAPNGRPAACFFLPPCRRCSAGPARTAAAPPTRRGAHRSCCPAPGTARAPARPTSAGSAVWEVVKRREG